MTNANQILERIKGVRQFQPSVIRNSMLMSIIQLLSFAGCFALMTLGVYEYFLGGSKALAGMHLIAALLLLLIWKLTKMVLSRNAYIIEMNEALDGE
jgi:hypothetical protein